MPSTATSDDFSIGVGGTLDPMWTFVNPLSDGSFKMTGSHVDITAPAGNTHDTWIPAATAPRIKQAVGNSEFQVVVKFESDLNATAAFKSQGILFEETPSHFVRVDFFDHGRGAKGLRSYGPGWRNYDRRQQQRNSHGADVFARCADR